jgi:hypothetical protein
VVNELPPGRVRLTPGNWFSIGMFSGPSPVELAPAPGANNPVLTFRDVTDIPAIFVADPFMVRHDDGLWYMFLEVFNDHNYLAEIALAVSGNGLDWSYRGVVLTEPFSLSYSYVFRWQGDYYMLPEMYQQDCLRLYRAEAFPAGWKPVATFLEGNPIADASIFRWANHWYIFACPHPADHDALRLYWADNLTGPWREHPKSPIIVGDPRRARPAGRVVEWGSGLVRFAQDCYPRYGTALRAFEIARLTPHEYSERPFEQPPIRKPPAGEWNSLAMHHIDAHRLDDGSWLAVADGHNHPSYADEIS